MALISCRECGQDISSEARSCPLCGVPHPGFEPRASTGTPESAEYVGLPAYHQNVFRRFDEAGGGFDATWNWAAFFFGSLWYFSKGIWVKALIQVGILIFTAGLGFFLVWIYCGIAGNYDYYLLARRGKQLY